MKVLVASLSILGFMPLFAGAAINNLNGQTGQTQTFATTSLGHISISSASNVHTFNWAGILQPSQGGTGASSFATGSVLFFQDGKINEDNTNLFWDDMSKSLGIGGDLNVVGSLSVGSSLNIAGASLVYADRLSVSTDFAINGCCLFFNGTGPEIYSPPGETINIAAETGKLSLQNNQGGSAAILDATLMVGSDKMFTFPNLTGTFSLLEGEQVFTGFKKFISSVSSTVQIGNSTTTSCLVMGDSDGAGVTYVIANDGVLSSTTTKPNICE